MTEPTPISVSIFLALLELVGGVALLVVGVQARRGRLPRNRWAGYRSRATLADDASWAAAHSAGGIFIVWAAVPLLIATLLLLTRPSLGGTLAIAIGATVLMGASILVGTVRAQAAARAARAGEPNGSPPHG